MLPIVNALKNNMGAIAMVGLVVAGHVYWKHLQDIGVGDQGADYPIKKVRCNSFVDGMSDSKSKRKSIEAGFPFDFFQVKNCIFHTCRKKAGSNHTCVLLFQLPSVIKAKLGSGEEKKADE